MIRDIQNPFTLGSQNYRLLEWLKHGPATTGDLLFVPRTWSVRFFSCVRKRAISLGIGVTVAQRVAPVEIVRAYYPQLVVPHHSKHCVLFVAVSPERERLTR